MDNLAEITHEMRNYLAAIKGFGSLLRRELETSPKSRQMADHIVQNADKLNQLISKIEES